MEMTNLKRSKSEKKSTEAIMYPEDGDDYDYGLRFSLNTDALKKLDVDKLEVGSDLMVMAKVRVTGFSENVSSSKTSRRADMLITDINLDHEKKDDKDSGGSMDSNNG